MGSSAVLIANPVAGSFRKSKIRIAKELIEKRGLRAEVLLSRRRGDIRHLAAASIDMSPEIIFVLGGDGTFNEAVNGLVHTEIPVSFLPSGTTNVLAQELGIPDKIDRAVGNSLRGKVRRISLGRVYDASGLLRYFILMAGAGFDAHAIYRTNPTIKGLLGKGAYIVSGLGVLSGYNPPPIDIRCGDRKYVGYTVIIGNGSCYGGKFKVTPDASLFDPYLHVFVLKNRTRFSIVKIFSGVITSTHLHMKNTGYFRTDNISLGGSSHVQIDGDYLGTLPVNVSVERECLSIVY